MPERCVWSFNSSLRVFRYIWNMDTIRNKVMLPFIYLLKLRYINTLVKVTIFRRLKLMNTYDEYKDVTF
jgi:hypothetical protein